MKGKKLNRKQPINSWYIYWLGMAIGAAVSHVIGAY